MPVNSQCDTLSRRGKRRLWGTPMKESQKLALSFPDLAVSYVSTVKFNRSLVRTTRESILVYQWMFHKAFDNTLHMCILSRQPDDLTSA